MGSHWLLIIVDIWYCVSVSDVHHKTVGFITYRVFSGNEPGASLDIIFEPINWIHYDISLRLDTHEPIYVRDKTLILSGDKVSLKSTSPQPVLWG